MKIIKEGNPELVHKRVHFLCDYCGCEFEATPKDKNFRKAEFDPFWVPEYLYNCTCPCCHCDIGSNDEMIETDLDSE